MASCSAWTASLGIFTDSSLCPDDEKSVLKSALAPLMGDKISLSTVAEYGVPCEFKRLCMVLFLMCIAA